MSVARSCLTPRLERLRSGVNGGLSLGETHFRHGTKLIVRRRVCGKANISIRLLIQHCERKRTDDTDSRTTWDVDPLTVDQAVCFDQGGVLQAELQGRSCQHSRRPRPRDEDPQLLLL